MVATMQSDLALVLSSFDSTSMFVAALPHAVETDAAGRHSFQERYLTMAKDDLENKRSSAERELSAAVAEYSEANDQANRIERKQLADASSAEQTALADAKKKGQTLSALQKQLKEADLRHAEADKLNKDSDKARTKKQSDQKHVAFITESYFNMLRSGGWEDSEARDEAIKTVSEVVSNLGAEQALMVAFPATFSLNPEQRKYFDKVVEEESAKIMMNHLAAVEKDLVDSSRDASLIQAEALGLWAIMDEAHDAVKAAEQATLSANDVLTKASAERQQAESSLANAERHVCSLSDKKVTLEVALEKLTNACGAIERLRIGDYSKQDEVKDQTKMDVDAEAIGTESAIAAA